MSEEVALKRDSVNAKVEFLQSFGCMSTTVRAEQKSGTFAEAQACARIGKMNNRRWLAHVTS